MDKINILKHTVLKKENHLPKIKIWKQTRTKSETNKKKSKKTFFPGAGSNNVII